MAADLSIHAYEHGSVREEVFEAFFANSLGHKYGPKITQLGLQMKVQEMDWMEACKIVSNIPKVWVGEVSWLKAALFEDGNETFVPAPVQAVSSLFGDDHKLIDDTFIAQLEACFITTVNQTSYDVTRWPEVEKFAIEHKGHLGFTVSW